MDFESMKEKFKGNEDFTSALTEIESSYTALSGKKETAVENEIKLRGGKQEIAKALGLDENIPLTELVTKVSETLTGYKTKIDSFETSASGKDLENASFKEQLSALTGKLDDITGKLSASEATNTLNDLKGKAREALAVERITDQNSQDLVLNANLSQLNSISDWAEFAKKTAEQYPNLTNSVHKPGAATEGASEEAAMALAQKEIKYGMPIEEEMAILQAKREQNL